MAHFKDKTKEPTDRLADSLLEVLIKFKKWRRVTLEMCSRMI